MATIPRAEEIVRNNSSGVRSVVGVRNAGAVGEAYARFSGGAVGKIADFMVEQQEKEDNFELQKAEIDYVNDLNSLEKQYKEKDFSADGMEAYEQELEKLNQTYHGRFRSQEMQQRFSLVQAKQGGQAMARAGDIHHAKKVDFNRGEVTRQLKVLRDQFLEAETPEQMADIAANVDALLDGAESNEYISEAEKVDWRLKAQQSMAQGRFDMLDPESKLQATKKDWFKSLPLDTQAKLTRLAEQETVTHRADALVTSLSGMDPEQAYAHIEKHAGDPDTKAKAFQLYNQQLDREIKTKQLAGLGVMEDYALKVRQGKMKVDEIPTSELEKLNAGQIKWLYQAQDAAAEGDTERPKRTPTGLYDQMTAMIEQPLRYTPRQAREFFIKHQDKFSDGDVRIFSVATNKRLGKAAEAGDPAKVEGILTKNEMLKSKLNRLYPNKVDEDKKNAAFDYLRLELQEWILSEQQADIDAGREPTKPTDKEITDWINRRTNPREVLLRDHFLFFDKTVQMPNFEADTTLRDMLSDPELSRFEKFRSIIEYDSGWWEQYKSKKKAEDPAWRRNYEETIRAYVEDNGLLEGSAQ